MCGPRQRLPLGGDATRKMQVSTAVCFLMSSALFLMPHRLEADLAQDLLCLFMSAFSLQSEVGQSQHLDAVVWLLFIMCVAYHYLPQYTALLFTGFVMLGCVLE